MTTASIAKGTWTSDTPTLQPHVRWSCHLERPALSLTCGNNGETSSAGVVPVSLHLYQANHHKACCTQ